MTKSFKELRLILGDQLNANHSWFTQIDPSVLYVLMEVRSETDYVRHHVQKIVGIFAAMRHFASHLEYIGHSVRYIHLDAPENKQAISENIKQLIIAYNCQAFSYQEPDEFRVDEQLSRLSEELAIPCSRISTEHFYTKRDELKEFFEGKKSYLMERFYRYMRLKHSILVNEKKEPEGGKWNFDASNRKKLPKGHEPVRPLCFSNDVSELTKLLDSCGVETIGSIEDKSFLWPTTRKEALELLEFFCSECLPLFGDYQDAMSPGMWSGYHSRLSFSLNLKLISPKEVVTAAILEYRRNDAVSIEQIEGFVRQIIGWREYMRGIYWAEMPTYESANFFQNNRSLPRWFWTGETKMHCLRDTISQSMDKGYAHHIQRLMITGNFCLLAGIDPNAVDNWYLGIYVDAFQWVEITNTRGMSQYADGGIVGSKPYVSSAAYIHKMSHYCSTCFYDKSKRIGEKACPFNSLYWNFFMDKEPQLSSNPRIGMVYPQLKKMSLLERQEIKEQASFYMSTINEL